MFNYLAKQWSTGELRSVKFTNYSTQDQLVASTYVEQWIHLKSTCLSLLIYQIWSKPHSLYTDWSVHFAIYEQIFIDKKCFTTYVRYKFKSYKVFYDRTSVLYDRTRINELPNIVHYWSFDCNRGMIKDHYESECVIVNEYECKFECKLVTSRQRVS